MSGSQAEFVVVDVETTGLFPEGNDRVVEIALIRLDSFGRQIGRYETLINPMRDVGPTFIHGITAREVVDAPPFEVVAGDVVQLLRNAVIVAHNASFEPRTAGRSLPKLMTDRRLPSIPKASM